MARKYIKNCTGPDCEREKTPSRFAVLFSRIIFFILLLGFVGVTTYVLFFSPYLQISKIEVTGTQELDGTEIQQKVQASLQEKYFGVVSRNNFLFVSQKRISDILTGDFKKIRQVMLTKKFPDSIVVNIDERKALLVWCSGEKCFLIDENGTAYNEADFNSPELSQNHLLKISDTSGRDVAIGENILEKDYENYVLALKDALASVGFSASEEYSTPSRMAEEIRVKTVQGPEIYFSTQFPLEGAISTLMTVLKKEITPEKIGNLQYIDLRNENKIFYK